MQWKWGKYIELSQRVLRADKLQLKKNRLRKERKKGKISSVSEREWRLGKEELPKNWFQVVLDSGSPGIKKLT
jgi:hypothetical protein